MAGEPGYIKELKGQIKGITEAVAGTKVAIVRIDTTLSETLPGIKTGLTTLNGTVRKHEIDLALQQQAHEDCPARQAYSPGNPGAGGPRHLVIDLADNKTKAAVGGLLGAPTVLLLLEIGKLVAQHYWGG